ncbi:hypothetical protein GF406_02515 [candidate division KSB1 bacterium]|nr:hypothetical protein [candidate division KSB1 bacterium]
MRGLLIFLLIIPFSLFAQDSLAVHQDSLRVKLEQLENRLKDLEAKNEQDELQKLLEQAQQLKTEKKSVSDVGKKFHTGVRRQSGLNPNISMSGDFFGAVSSKSEPGISEPSDFTYGSNRFELREVELSFAAPLDPFTRGKTFLSLTENSISIEEAYLQWLNLPLNMNLKVGLFNPEFGILNRYHDHALPQFDRPMVLTRFFTSANLGGMGLAGNFLLKPMLGADASLLDLAIIRGGTGASFTQQGELNLLYVANLTQFHDVTENTYFEWRMGGATGYNDSQETYRTTVINVSTNLKWIPADKAKYRTFDWKTEYFHQFRETWSGTVKSNGFYTSVQNKLNARWWITGRFDYVEWPWPMTRKINEQAFTLGLDFWQSDFVFLRGQYQYTHFNRNDLSPVALPGYPSHHELVLQINWAMGPHKHEAY